MLIHRLTIGQLKMFNSHLFSSSKKRPGKTSDRMPVIVDFVDIDSLREYVETPAWAMKVSTEPSDQSLTLYAPFRIRSCTGSVKK